MNDDTGSRLSALEVKLGLRDVEPPPEDEHDQQHSNYLLGLEAELAEAKRQKNRTQIDAVTAEMTAVLDKLSSERRRAVLKIMEHDRPLRGQPDAAAGPRLGTLERLREH